MNRDLWLACLTDKHSPAYPCPECHKGNLALVQGSLKEEQTVSSKAAMEEVGFDEDFYRSVFTAWLKCNYPTCQQLVAIIGNGGMDSKLQYDEEVHDQPIHVYFERYKPQFCCPMPDIFLLHENSPAEVNGQLRSAFRLFWSDKSASANRIRVSLEKLMDHFKVPKRGKGKNGKPYMLTLHQRIEEFSKIKPTEGQRLMALKLLGNTASHQGDIIQNDLLDGFEILEYVLAELFEQRSQRVDILTRNLTKKHASGKKKKK